jgi:hypothetical protein
MMRRILLVVCLLALPLAGFAQEVRQPRQKIELGNVTLRDGRVLEGAKLLGSGAARKLNIAHKGGIEQLPFEAFTPEFLEAHREHIENVRDEYIAEDGIRRKARSEQRRIESRRQADIRVAMIQAADREREVMERSKKDLADAERALKQREEAEARAAAFKAAELARSRDGIILEFLARGYDACDLTVRNVHDNPRRLDWRDLRARKTDGRLVIPVNCESTDERDRSLDIRSGEKRAFRIRFMGGNDDIEAITWSDGAQEVEPYRQSPKAPAMEAP